MKKHQSSKGNLNLRNHFFFFGAPEQPLASTNSRQRGRVELDLYVQTCIKRRIYVSVFT